MINNLIEAILPELRAKSEKARDEYLISHPTATSYDFPQHINGSNFVFKWSKDTNVSNPKWHFRIEEIGTTIS